MKYRSNRPLRRPEYWIVVLAVVIVGICFYGIRAAAIYGLAAVTAVLTDMSCLFLRGRSYRMIDLSNVGNALILAMMFPASIPYSVVLLSTIFAVAVGTHVFGTRKNHLFPPAAVGYLFALLCWKNEVLQFPDTGTHFALFHNDVELSGSLSSMLNSTGVLRTEILDLLIGAVRTPMGTGCILLLLVSFIVLAARRQLPLWAWIGYCTGLTFGMLLTGLPVVQVLAGNMVLFSMVFLAADAAVMPCRTYLGYFGTLVTGILVCFLIWQYRMEYAPVVAVMLICPLWRAIAMWEQRLTTGTEEADES